MLSLTRKCDYALIALSHLGRSPGKVTSAREISETYRIPLPVLMNILKQLTREGIVASVRGARGGYHLAIEPSELSLRRLIMLLEGPIRLVQCAARGEGRGFCNGMRWCPVQTSALRLHRKLERFLEEVSLADIVESPTPLSLAVDEPGNGQSDGTGVPG